MILGIILLAYLAVIIGTGNTECMDNPLVYGAKQLSEKNNVPVMCRCDALSPGQTPTLMFNEEGSWFTDLGN